MPRWFFKTTEPIPVKEGYETRIVNGEVYVLASVQGGIDTTTGFVYINYSYTKMWHPFFWEMHAHEFLHRLFWKLKLERIDRVMDYINRLVFIWEVNKRIRIDEESY